MGNGLWGTAGGQELFALKEELEIPVRLEVQGTLRSKERGGGAIYNPMQNRLDYTLKLLCPALRHLGAIIRVPST